MYGTLCLKTLPEEEKNNEMIRLRSPRHSSLCMSDTLALFFFIGDEVSGYDIILHYRSECSLSDDVS